MISIKMKYKVEQNKLHNVIKKAGFRTCFFYKLFINKELFEKLNQHHLSLYCNFHFWCCRVDDEEQFV